jgi:hypothetical protein
MNAKPSPHLSVPGKKSPEQETIGAIAAFTSAIAALAEEIRGVREEVGIIADYAIRQGKKEGLFKPEEYPDDEAENAEQQGD